jgi:hypothetical protein
MVLRMRVIKIQPEPNPRPPEGYIEIRLNHKELADIANLCFRRASSNSILAQDIMILANKAGVKYRSTGYEGMVAG